MGQRLRSNWAIVGLLALPFTLLALLPLSGNSSSTIYVALTGLLALTAVCLLGLLRRVTGRGPLLALMLIAYFLDFAASAGWRLAHPKAVSFPSLSLPGDLMWFNRGLALVTVGVFALVAGYLVTERRTAWGILRIFNQRVTRTSNPLFALLIMYGIGLVGRSHQIASGAALYLYNSPAFSSFAVRGDPNTGGFFALLAALCPVAAGGMLAYGLINTHRLALTIAGIMYTIELLYFSFSLYKFGLISVVGVPLLIMWVTGRRRMVAIMLPTGAIAVLAIFAVVNVARGDLLSFNKSLSGPSQAWLGAFTASASQSLDASSTSAGSPVRGVADRLLGAEAAAVAVRGASNHSLYLGKTYENIPVFLVPAILRSGAQPFYIPWETQYVGLSPTNPTVIPMPAIVEAYLNFDIPGVVLVMLIMGLVTRQVDLITRDSVVARHAPLIGFWCYCAYQMLNIEQNLFIVVVPLLKLGAVFLLINEVFALLGRKRLSAPAPVGDAA